MRLLRSIAAERYFFVTTCLDTYLNGPYGEAIHEMRDAASSETLDASDVRRLIGDRELRKAGIDPKTLETDWAISWHRSVWRGIPCIYIVHSRIEYIFTLDGRVPTERWSQDEDEDEDEDEAS